MVPTVPLEPAAVQRIDFESVAGPIDEHESVTACTGEGESFWPWIVSVRSAGVRKVIGEAREVCTAGCESKRAAVATGESVAVWTADGKSGGLQALDGEST